MDGGRPECPTVKTRFWRPYGHYFASMDARTLITWSGRAVRSCQVKRYTIHPRTWALVCLSRSRWNESGSM